MQMLEGKVGVDNLTLLSVLDSPTYLKQHKVPEALDAVVSASGGTLRVEFNPSRGYGDSGLAPCPFEELREVTGEVWSEMSRRFPITEPLDSARVSRLDLARDFENVEHVHALTQGFLTMPRPRRIKVAAYDNNPRLSWGPNGLTVGGKNQVTFYDRHAKDSRVSEGVARFEVRLRPEWLKSAGIGHFGDVQRDACVEVLHSRWRWARFNNPVIAEKGLLEAVRNAPWSEREKAFFFWKESNRLRGYDYASTTRDRRKHEDRITEIGAVSPLRDAACVRLDLHRGREVIEGNSRPKEGAHER